MTGEHSPNRISSRPALLQLCGATAGVRGRAVRADLCGQAPAATDGRQRRPPRLEGGRRGRAQPPALRTAIQRRLRHCQAGKSLSSHSGIHTLFGLLKLEPNVLQTHRGSYVFRSSRLMHRCTHALCELRLSTHKVRFAGEDGSKRFQIMKEITDLSMNKIHENGN